MKNSSIDMKNHTTNGTNAHTNGQGEVHARIGRGDAARDGDDLRGHLFPGDEENHPAPDHDGMVTEALVETPQQRHIDRGRDGAGPGRILDQGEQPAMQIVELVVASTDLGGQFGIMRAQNPFGEAGQLGRHPPHPGEQLLRLTGSDVLGMTPADTFGHMLHQPTHPAQIRHQVHTGDFPRRSGA